MILPYRILTNPLKDPLLTKSHDPPSKPKAGVLRIVMLDSSALALQNGILLRLLPL